MSIYYKNKVVRHWYVGIKIEKWDNGTKLTRHITTKFLKCIISTYLLSPILWSRFLIKSSPYGISPPLLHQKYIDKTNFSLYLSTLRIYPKFNHFSSFSAFTLGNHSLCFPVFCNLLGISWIFYLGNRRE